MCVILKCVITEISVWRHWRKGGRRLGACASSKLHFLAGHGASILARSQTLQEVVISGLLGIVSPPKCEIQEFPQKSLSSRVSRESMA